MCALCGADIIKRIAYLCSLLKELNCILHAHPPTSIQYVSIETKRYSIVSQGMIYSTFSSFTYNSNSFSYVTFLCIVYGKTRTYWNIL